MDKPKAPTTTSDEPKATRLPPRTPAEHEGRVSVTVTASGKGYAPPLGMTARQHRRALEAAIRRTEAKLARARRGAGK